MLVKRWVSIEGVKGGMLVLMACVSIEGVGGLAVKGYDY